MGACAHSLFRWYFHEADAGGFVFVAFCPEGDEGLVFPTSYPPSAWTEGEQTNIGTIDRFAV